MQLKILPFFLLIFYTNIAFGISVTINPSDYLGQWRLNGITADVSGSQTVDIQEGNYSIRVGSVGNFSFSLDTNGNVLTDNVSAIGSNGQITFNTVSVNFNAANYFGEWRVSRGSPLNFTVGSLSNVKLVPGIVYRVDIGAIGNFNFALDSNSSITVPNGSSAQGGVGTITFNTLPVDINVGNYNGQWRLSRAVPSVFTLGSVQSIGLVPSVNYRFDVGAVGRFIFNLDQSGSISVLNSVSALSVGNAMTLNTVSVDVDSMGNINSWRIERADPAALVFGPLENIQLVPALDYQLRLADGERHNFSIASPCSISPSPVVFQSGNFDVVCSPEPQTVEVTFNGLNSGQIVSDEFPLNVMASGGTISSLECSIAGISLGNTSSDIINVSVDSKNFLDGLVDITCVAKNVDGVEGTSSVSITIDNIQPEDEEAATSVATTYVSLLELNGIITPELTCQEKVDKSFEYWKGLVAGGSLPDCADFMVKKTCTSIEDSPFGSVIARRLQFKAITQPYTMGPGTPNYCFINNGCEWYEFCGVDLGIDWQDAWDNISEVFSNVDFSVVMDIIDGVAAVWDTFTWSGLFRLVGNVVGVLGDIGIIDPSVAQSVEDGFVLIADLTSVGGWIEAIEVIVVELTEVDDAIDTITNFDQNIISYLDDNAALLGQTGLVPQNTIDDFRSNLNGASNLLDGNYLEGGTIILENVNEDMGAVIRSISSVESNWIQYLNNNIQTLNDRNLIDDPQFQDFANRLDNVTQLLDLGDVEQAINEVADLQIDLTGVLDDAINLDQARAYDGIKNMLIQIKERMEDPAAIPTIATGIILRMETLSDQGDVSNKSKKKVNKRMKNAIAAFVRGDLQGAREELRIALRVLVKREIENVDVIENITSLIDNLDTLIGDSGAIPEEVVPALLYVTNEAKQLLSGPAGQEFETHIKKALKRLINGKPNRAKRQLEKAIAVLQDAGPDVSSYITQIEGFIDQIDNFFN